jgi:tight adherence protein B
MTGTAVACVMGTGVGLVGLMVGLRRQSQNELDGRSSTVSRMIPARMKGSRSPGTNSRFGVSTLAVALVSAVVVGAITRWPVAAVLAAVASVGLPSLLRSSTLQDATRRTEAVAVWTELLRDTLTASAGLAQAIVATADLAPEDIRLFVAHLADRIMSGVPMDDALRIFADDIDDPSAQEVVYALRLAANSRAQKLVELLSALAESTRDHVTMRLRVETSRASARSGVRTVVVFSISFVALLSLVARSYLSPFSSVTGQLVLIVVGACYTFGVALMVRLVRPVPWRNAER